MTPASARFDSLDPVRGSRSFRFEGIRQEITACTLSEVIPALEGVATAAAAGRYAAGYIAYEAAAAFDAALVTHEPPAGLPLLWFGIYDAREEIEPLADLSDADAYELGPLTSSVTAEGYAAAVRRILDLIAAGDTYQVNLTLRQRCSFTGSPAALYRDVARAQRSAFCALITLPDYALVSASPELFFRSAVRSIELRPMKGTRPRGRWFEEDRELARILAESPKERAENLMIVDLIRNDLGRVADFGSVQVPSLFEVESYPTVHQLTSTVTGRLREGLGLVDLFRALFPSGSVTGAPKIRTSAIIRELENSPRGVYTGAIGFVGPDEAVFSVAIRTALLDLRHGALELGVGSGITADSDAEAEFRETLGKAAFLHHRSPRFELLESLRLELPGGYLFLEQHLERLSRSARYFGRSFRIADGRQALADLARELDPGTYKIRLLVDERGRCRTGCDAIVDNPAPACLDVASAPVDDCDPFLYHKTTHRRMYEDAATGLAGVDDVVLFNRRGEITETTTSNLVLRLDQVLVTPPIESGLLPGIQREETLRKGTVYTRLLTLEDLRRATEIHLLNSVRGWRRALLVEGGGAVAGVPARGRSYDAGSGAQL